MHVSDDEPLRGDLADAVVAEAEAAEAVAEASEVQAEAAEAIAETEAEAAVEIARINADRDVEIADRVADETQTHQRIEAIEAWLTLHGPADHPELRAQLDALTTNQLLISEQLTMLQTQLAEAERPNPPDGQSSVNQNEAEESGPPSSGEPPANEPNETPAEPPPRRGVRWI